MVDSGYGAHPFFEAHAYAVRAPVTVVPGTTPAGDPIGHGTGEAANVFAIAPDAELWPVRASNQQGDMVAAVAGFMRAKMEVPDVLSNSWGGDYPDPLPPEPHAADRALCSRSSTRSTRASSSSSRRATAAAASRRRSRA